jgi:hypothetical protein
VNAIEARHARAAASLAIRVVDHWRTSTGYTATARRFGVTSAFVRLCVENAGAIRAAEPEGPGPARDLADEPIDAVEVEGWAMLLSAGWTAVDVAADAGVDVDLVRSILGTVDLPGPAPSGDAPRELRGPRVRLMFPAGSLTPSSPCPHRGPIRKGDRVVCMVCHASGLDGIDLPHPGTVPPPPDEDEDEDDEPRGRMGPATAPKPEPKVPKLDDQAMTRAQRRKLQERLTADQRKEQKEADRDARRARRGKANWERRGDNMGR